VAATVRERLVVDVAKVVFRSGRIDAVYGLLLADDRKVVVKVHRSPVKRPRSRARGPESSRIDGLSVPGTGWRSLHPQRHVVTIETLLGFGCWDQGGHFVELVVTLG
jgi:hypothetical protein